MTDSVEYLNADQVAAKLHCSVRTLLDQARSGSIPAAKVAGKWLWTPEDVQAIYEARRTGPKPEVASVAPITGSARQRKAERA